MINNRGPVCAVIERRWCRREGGPTLARVGARVHVCWWWYRLDVLPQKHTHTRASTGWRMCIDCRWAAGIDAGQTDADWRQGGRARLGDGATDVASKHRRSAHASANNTRPLPHLDFSIPPFHPSKHHKSNWSSLARSPTHHTSRKKSGAGAVTV